jgi:hypothetical protein
MGHKPEPGEIERIKEIDDVAKENAVPYKESEAARNQQEQDDREERWEQQRERNDATD